MPNESRRDHASRYGSLAQLVLCADARRPSTEVVLTGGSTWSEELSSSLLLPNPRENLDEKPLRNTVLLADRRALLQDVHGYARTYCVNLVFPQEIVGARNAPMHRGRTRNRVDRMQVAEVTLSAAGATLSQVHIPMLGVRDEMVIQVVELTTGQVYGGETHGVTLRFFRLNWGK